MKSTSLNLARTAAVALTFSAAFHSAMADQLAEIKKAGKIRIAVAMGTPLFSYADANLKPAGSDVETADALAKDLGVEWELVSIPNSARIPTLQANKADIVVADLSITEERKKVIDFSRPYAVITLIVGGPKNVTIKDYADLAGKKIAVTRATVNDTLVTQNAKGAEVVRFEDDATLITSVITAQADIFSSTPSNLSEIQKRAPGRNVERKFDQQDFLLGIALNKNEPQLKAWIDGWVATNIKNGRLNAIYKKFHGRELPASVTQAQ